METPLLTTRVVARLAAALHATCGALVALSALALPYGSEVNREGLLVVAVAALGVSVVLEVLPWERMSRRLTLWVVPEACTLIAAHDFFLGHGSGGFWYGRFYVVTFAWLGLSHARGAPTRFAPVIAVGYLLPLLAHGHPDASDIASVAYALPISVLVGETVAFVTTRAARSEAWLREGESRFRELFAANPNPMWVYDEETLAFLEVNDSAVAHYGYSRDEFRSMTIADVRPVEDRALLADSIERRASDFQESHGWRHVRRDGSLIDVEIRSNRLRWGDRPAVLVSVFDVTDRTRMELELRDRAIHDQLTGLGNRVMLKDRVEHALQRCEPGAVALLLFDLDGFKMVNDALGHSAGDELLFTVAAQLRGAVGAVDTVARLGGDEFVVLLEDVEGPETAVEVARRTAAALAEGVGFDERDVTVTASVGIATSTPDGTFSDLLRAADVAMYSAKRAGGNRAVLFEPGMEAAARRRLETATDLRRAIDCGELVVHYQPVTTLGAPRAVVGVEALLRWQHPEWGLVPPAEFIPLAEETGLISEIGLQVLEMACRDIGRWNAAHPTQPLDLAVNLSARQLHDPALAVTIALILDRSGFPARGLTLEITETAVMLDVDRSITELTALKRLGVRLALDDFGTGYSSLAYLRRLPLDVLKIDRSFVDVVPTDVEGSLLVKGILRLAETLGLEVIAEGVENESQEEALTGYGCHLAQGFHFGYPVPLEELDGELETLVAAG